jgi:lipopolysaccharide cholinephosphotransferase|tara:strand:- start:923 stop:1621 length:699 start_codon:yes stop_codon:yes gene_type:complete
MTENNILDQNFKEIIKILNDNSIYYWLCHGTLLGIIRDGNLIDWDHDIDIALWEGQISRKTIINIMEKNNFKLRKEFKIDNSIISFEKVGGRIIDINFYEIVKSKKTGEDIAYVKWFIPKNNIMKLIDALSESKKYDGKFKKIIRLTLPFQKIFSKIKSFLIESNFFYKEIGYSEPANLLKKIKKINLHGIEVNVPVESEKYLQHIYGEDWRKPKKNYVWYKDSNSLFSRND